MKLQQSSISKKHGLDNPRTKSRFQSGVALAAYIPHPFPFGHYRTKALVLAYYNALAAGDTDIEVAV